MLAVYTHNHCAVQNFKSPRNQQLDLKKSP